MSGARETVAASLGAQPGEIVFTACGSEGNNLAVLGAVKARAAWADHIVVTGYEHPSVQNPVAALEKEGWRVTVVRRTPPAMWTPGRWYGRRLQNSPRHSHACEQ